MNKQPQISDTEKESPDCSNEPEQSRLSQAAHECGSKIREGSQVVFRALGLAIIVSALRSLRHPFGRGLEEPTKIALHQNRSTALLQSLIHIIPVGIALWEIVLNIHTYYVGSSALNLVYYQLGAKAHEIMIHASLAAVVLSYFRHQLTTAGGIPFGALFGTLAINQVSYLWSMEFWGSVGSKHLPFRRKLAMMVLVSICFILAAASGPASAILLVPRLDYWPAGSTNIWLNASFNDIWPDRLEGWLVPEYCAESHEFVISNECPSSEWQFIQDYATILANAVPQHLSGTELEISGPRHSQLSGKNSHRQFAAVRKWFSSDEDINPIIMTGRASTTQQAAISDALEVTAKLWENAISSADSRGGHGSIPFDHQIAAHSISDDYFQPYTIATCIIDTILGSDDQRPLAIPITAGINYGADQSSLSYLGFANSSLPKELGHSTLIEAPAIEYPSIVRAGLHQLPGPKSNTRVEWFELPRNLFANSSIGVVILLPSNLPVSKRSESTTNMLVCNVAAGWGNSVLNATTFRGSMSATSSLVIIDDLVLPRGKSELLADSVISPFQSLNDIDISFFMPFFPSKPVGISKKWAEYLNPWIPASNLTLIDSLVKNLPWNNTHQIPLESLGELILSSLVTNGLARVGFNSQLQGNLRWTGDGEERRPNGKLWYSGKGDVFTVDTEESKNWVKLRVNSVLKGYAYNCNGTPPKVAVAFLLTYCTLAIAHYFYSGISGISSTCWDSIAEVTALAMNSTPTAALRNTCAGISEISIFKLPVRILAMRDLEGEGEHLELVFGDVDEEQAKKMSIKPNRKYGTMPAIASTPAQQQGHLKTL